MIVGAIGDLHGFLPSTASWPHLDLFIFGGDLCGPAASQEWIDAIAAPWFGRISATHKIGTFGNWDSQSLDYSTITKISGMKFYVNEHVDCVLGKTFITPASYVPPGHPRPWAFGYTEEALATLYNNIASDTRAIISHAPAYGLLDYGYLKHLNSYAHIGSHALRSWLDNNKSDMRLIVHHEHCNGGNKFRYHKCDIWNAAAGPQQNTGQLTLIGI